MLIEIEVWVGAANGASFAPWKQWVNDSNIATMTKLDGDCWEIYYSGEPKDYKIYTRTSPQQINELVEKEKQRLNFITKSNHSSHSTRSI